MQAPVLDARVARTQRQLRSAALTLAADTPIEEVSVADLAREAGINRATFYKHADSPLQVLREALIDDLDALRDGFLTDAADPHVDFVALWRQAAQATAEHVARFEPIYRRGFADDASGSLADLLSRHIADSMEALFLERPDLLPAHKRRDHALLSAAFAAYLGHGLTGILRVWFADGTRNVRVYADAVVSALPVWMPQPQPQPAPEPASKPKPKPKAAPKPTAKSTSTSRRPG